MNTREYSYFFITIKRVGKRMPQMSDYNAYFKRLYNKEEFRHIFHIIKDTYEIDAHSRMHYHGLVRVQNQESNPKLINEAFVFDIYNIFKTNWHINVRQCFTEVDLSSVRSYMEKDEIKSFLEALKDGEYLFQDRTLKSTKLHILS